MPNVVPYQNGSREVEGRWRAVARHLPPPQFSSLDVGCAEGVMTERLARMGAATGVDDSGRSAEPATWTLIRRTADVPFLASLGSFDVVLALSILHHMHDGAAAFQLLRSMSHRMFVEIPDVREKGVANACDLSGVEETLKADGVPICVSLGHDRRFQRTVWLVE